MKMIAVAIDESTLRALDRIANRADRGRAGAIVERSSRSAVVRRALQEFVARQEKAEREAAERVIVARHARQLSREAAALVSDQAEP
jgi:metal-responsive CopG/Arc/MetJ family transcriptional regulator